MKTLPWFRMYHEARSDRKLATLNDREHRLWFNLLCLAAEQSDRGEIPPTDDYLIALEIGADDAAEAVALIDKLARLHIVSRDVTPSHNDIVSLGVTFIHFRDRQYDKPSDMPEATRARKEKQRDIEHKSRDVTPSHAQEESRGEKKKRTSSSGDDGFGEFWLAYPKKVAKQDAIRVWKRLKPDLGPILEALAIQSKSSRWREEGGRFIPYPATWLNGGRWDDEVSLNGTTPLTETMKQYNIKERTV